ncbi:FAD-binding oxidoreductase [Rhodoglobus sp. NPDC076762]
MSSSHTSSKRVAVIGGGILGVSTALHLQKEGAFVTLITDAELASGASGRSLSWLNSAGVRSDAYHAFRVAGIDRYRTLFARNPRCEWLQFDGGVYWTREDNQELIARRHAHETSHAYDSHLVASDGVEAYAPGVRSEAVTGTAIANAGDGWVSLPHLIAELVAELSAWGGQIVTNAGKCSVDVIDGIARGVIAGDSRRFPADAVLVACGAWTPEVVAPLGVTIDDGSPLSMVVITEPCDLPIKAVMNTPRAAMRPNPNSTLALDHDWYEDQIVEDDHGNFSIPESAVHELVAEASALIEGQPALAAASWKIGRKPIPGDGEPVFGELSQVPGCFVAFSHSGATVGLIAGELMAGEILTGAKHPMLETFRPERFQR